MLQLLSKVDIIDNSGGTRGRIIKILNKKKYGKVGGLVLLSVTKNVSNSKIRKGTVHKAIIVRTSVKNRVLEKSTRFYNNSVVLVKVNGNDYLPIGSRVKGAMSNELKVKIGCIKILALGNKII
jgi:large subunit ribosomal protein L14